MLPVGRSFLPEIYPLSQYRCAVKKDAGDDPDVTDGCEVWAEVCLEAHAGEISFRAGDGVGVVTRPGLKIPPGEPAINPTPRKMIAEAIRSIYPEQEATVTVGITAGEELARRTFNSRMGIKGGLSVLGTSGIVHPMSEDALKETIRLELSMLRQEKHTDIALVFGNQGEAALQSLGIRQASVQMSNYVGFALESCADLGYQSAVLIGQPGKMVKVAGGSMQTHSRYSDGRRETLCTHLALMGAPSTLLSEVMHSITLEGMISPVAQAGYAPVWDSLCNVAEVNAYEFIHGRMNVGVLIIDSFGHELGRGQRLKGLQKSEAERN